MMTHSFAVDREPRSVAVSVAPLLSAIEAKI